MKKIFLMFSIIFVTIFTLNNSIPRKEKEEIKVNLFMNEECSKYESTVTVTSASNVFTSSGVIVGTYGNVFYVATSSSNYNEGFVYEVITSDGARHRAQLLGAAKEDGVMILKVSADTHYCSAKISSSKLIHTLEQVYATGRDKENSIEAISYVSVVGACKDPDNDKFAKYYVSVLNNELGEEFLGAGVFDASLNGNLQGIVTGNSESYRGLSYFLDIDKLMNITHEILKYGKYTKKYIKYDLLDVNSLTNHEKYLYSLSEDLTYGVVVDSVHYMNYIFGGLNQGMVIEAVNGVIVKNCYELDSELANYKKGSKVSLKIRKISGRYKTVKIKL